MRYFAICCLFGISLAANGCLANTNAQQLNDFDDAAKEIIATASSGSADVLMALSVLGPEAAFFMKVIVPVGSALAGEINPEPSSSKYKDLMQLKRRTSESWFANKRAIESSTQAIGAMITAEQYYLKVIFPLNKMKNWTDEYVDPSVYKPQSFVDGFKRACRFTDEAPENILLYLVGRLVEYCNGPVSASEAQSLAAQREYLVHVMLRFKVYGDEMPDIGLYMEEFQRLYGHLADKSILHLDSVNAFNRRYATYKAAFAAFFAEIQSEGSIGDGEQQIDNCFLRKLLNGSNFNYPETEAFVVQLRDQLVVLEYIAGICANLSFDGHKPSMDRYVEDIASKINIIATHTANWLNVSLESAWPTIHIGILREQLLRVAPDPGVIKKDTLQIVLELSMPKLADTGTPNFVYQGLIAKNGVANEEHFFEGIPKYCTYNTDVYGFDVLLNRLPLNFSSEQDKEKTHAHLMDVSNFGNTTVNPAFLREMGKQYNAENVTVIASALKKAVGQFISEPKFHCWAILRAFANWPWLPCPTIEHSMIAYRYGNMTGLTSLWYKNEGKTTEDCEIFRFLFYI